MIEPLARPVTHRPRLAVLGGALLALACVAACDRRATTTSSAATSTPAASAAVAPDTSAWPAYPGARPLTSGHVTGAPNGDRPGPHISWSASHTTDAPDRVVAFYRSKLGTKGSAEADGQWTWSEPPPPALPKRVLHVVPSSSKGPWSKVDVPAQGTVIMESEMTAEDR